MAIFAWSSLGGGFFSGRFTRRNLDSFESYFDKLCVECYCHEANFRRLGRARKLARQLGVTPAQVALAWAFRQDMNLFALVGCASPSEFGENAKALQIELSDEDTQWLEAGRGMV
jgi:aryl-alcohol dehydrogenase-like predicted oxidoreductase